MTEQISIFIVDDHQMFIDGLSFIFQKYDNYEIVGQSNSGIKALEQIRQLKPDIVLLDINLPHMDGIEIAHRMKDAQIPCYIIAVSMHQDKYRVKQMIKAGAKGFILKTDGAEEIIRAVDTVFSGKTYFSQEVAGILADAIHKKDSDPMGSSPPPLSPRELEILKLIANGLTNKEIAAQLSISKKTVDTHRKNILHKLNLSNTALLIKYAVERGMI